MIRFYKIVFCKLVWFITKSNFEKEPKWGYAIDAFAIIYISMLLLMFGVVIPLSKLLNTWLTIAICISLITIIYLYIFRKIKKQRKITRIVFDMDLMASYNYMYITIIYLIISFIAPFFSAYFIYKGTSIN